MCIALGLSGFKALFFPVHATTELLNNFIQVRLERNGEEAQINRGFFKV